MQTRDKVQCITVPKINIKIICPFRAVRSLKALYPFTSATSLLQVPSHQGLIPLTERFLKSINMSLDLEPNYFTFHDLRRSGATFAYNVQGTVHGRQTVSGNIFSQITPQVNTWLMH